MQLQNQNFDIIGDIHGYADALIRLLEKLGYTRNNDGVYSHPNRKVIFLGDFIDRGEEQALVLGVVMRMAESGNALAVMGNHEYNAICYHTNDVKGKPLREHSEKNFKQHQKFLSEFPVGEESTQQVIEWFKTLPIFLDLEGFRVIHACWHEASLEAITPYLESNNLITDSLLLKSCDSSSKEFTAIETLLKGLELNLPDGNYFLDKDGNRRTAIRVKWWTEKAETYQDYALVYDAAKSSISSKKLAQDKIIPSYMGGKPVFFGHYWFTGTPTIVTNKTACLDYSVGNNEKLVCYRWSEGDTTLSNDNFVMVDA